MKIIRKMSTDQTYILKLGVNTLAWSGLLAFFLCSFRGAEGELPEQQMINMYLAIAAVIIAGLGVSSWRIVHRERHKPVHRESFLSIAWMIFCAVLAAVGMEYICNPSFKSLSLHYLLWNIYYPFEISPPSERCCWVLLKPRKPLKIRQFIHAKAL